MAGAEEMAKNIPHAQLHIFEHSAHMGFMEEPEELVATLKQWITALTERQYPQWHTRCY